MIKRIEWENIQERSTIAVVGGSLAERQEIVKNIHTKLGLKLMSPRNVEELSKLIIASGDKIKELRDEYRKKNGTMKGYERSEEDLMCVSITENLMFTDCFKDCLVNCRFYGMYVILSVSDYKFIRKHMFEYIVGLSIPNKRDIRTLYEWYSIKYIYSFKEMKYIIRTIIEKEYAFCIIDRFPGVGVKCIPLRIIRANCKF